jgi:hypothetical protein
VQDIDLFATAGKNAAIVRSLDAVQVNDGVLDLHFGASIDNPLIDGIIIEQVSTGIGGTGEILPNDYRVSQNYPNPFNGRTMFRCELPGRSRLTFRVFDTLGRQIVARDLGELSAGEHSFSWNAAESSGAALSSGVFVYSVESAFGRSCGTMVHLK